MNYARRSESPSVLRNLACTAGLVVCCLVEATTRAEEPTIARLTPARADEQRRAAMNSQGNAERGRQLFSSASAKCDTCHKVAGTGGEAGPDLSLVAGKLDRTHLIESLLDPSALILEGYRTTIADFNHGFIRTLDPDRPAAAASFAGGLRRPVDLRFAPDGTLYVLLRNAWVIDGAFKPATGALLAIRPATRTR